MPRGFRANLSLWKDLSWTRWNCEQGGNTVTRWQGHGKIDRNHRPNLSWDWFHAQNYRSGAWRAHLALKSSLLILVFAWTAEHTRKIMTPCLLGIWLVLVWHCSKTLSAKKGGNIATDASSKHRISNPIPHFRRWRSAVRAARGSQQQVGSWQCRRQRILCKVVCTRAKSLMVTNYWHPLLLWFYSPCLSTPFVSKYSTDPSLPCKAGLYVCFCDKPLALPESRPTALYSSVRWW